MRSTWWCIAIMFSVSACASEGGRIPDGKYESPHRMAITVHGENLEFDVLDASGLSRSESPRKYRYIKRTDGSLRIYGSSNDTWFIDNIARYVWRWDGTQISQHERAGGQLLLFSPTSGE